MAHHLYRKFLHWTRTLHTYATMLALILMVFFAFTGFMMNHGDWFKIDDIKPVDRVTTMPAALAQDMGADHKLKVVEYLRAHEQARGEMTGYDEPVDAPAETQPSASAPQAAATEAVQAQDNPAQFGVHFTGAGRKMDFTITRADGKVEVHEEIHNAWALMADLHMGKGSGEMWRRFIDATAIFLLFASLTGVILWISLPKRRMLGIVALVASIVLCGGCYWWMVP